VRALAAGGLFTHDWDDGTPFATWIQRYYPPRAGGSWLAGENLVWATDRLDPAQAIAAWLASPPHRRILLDRSWRELGVGTVLAQEAPGVLRAQRGDRRRRLRHALIAGPRAAMVSGVEPQVIGVDVGGTKILAGLIGRDGTVLAHREYPTPVETEEALLDGLEAAVREFLDERVVAVGFGIPSQIDQREGIALGSVNIPLRGVPFRQKMIERLDLPVGIDNDANAAAIAEWGGGAGRGPPHRVMLTLGTGVGGGLILGRKPYRGWFGAGAEIGHMVIVHDGLKCRCGGHGHLESYASGKAADELAAEAFGPAADAHRLVRLAREGDALAIQILKGVGEHLGSGIASLVNIFNPELIVIGGGFAAAGEFLFEPAQAIADREVLVSVRDSYRIVRAELGTSAGMIGAGMVAFETLETTTASA
jgi:glucokinase